MVAVIQAGFFFFFLEKRGVCICVQKEKRSWGKPVRYKFSLWVPKFFSTSKRRCPRGGRRSLALSLSLASALLLRKPPRSVRMLSLHSVAGNKKSTYDSAQQNLESTGEKEAEWVEKSPEIQINTRLRLRNPAAQPRVWHLTHPPCQAPVQAGQETNQLCFWVRRTTVEDDEEIQEVAVGCGCCCSGSLIKSWVAYFILEVTQKVTIKPCAFLRRLH